MRRTVQLVVEGGEVDRDCCLIIRIAVKNVKFFKYNLSNAVLLPDQNVFVEKKKTIGNHLKLVQYSHLYKGMSAHHGNHQWSSIQMNDTHVTEVVLTLASAESINLATFWLSTYIPLNFRSIQISFLLNMLILHLCHWVIHTFSLHSSLGVSKAIVVTCVTSLRHHSGQ